MPYAIELLSTRSSFKAVELKPPGLVRLGGTFDLVLEVVALGRQELRDPVDAAR
jgi:hypothetical protein